MQTDGDNNTDSVRTMNTPTQQQAKHTPGPWQVASNDFCQWVTNEVGKAQIAKAFQPAGMSPETYRANLALIVAAPQLLEALQAFLDAEGAMIGTEYGNELLAKALAQARAAIQAATRS